MMPFLDSNVRDTGLVVGLQLDTRLSHGREFMLQDRLELSLTHAVAVQDNTVRLEPR